MSLIDLSEEPLRGLVVAEFVSLPMSKNLVNLWVVSAGIDAKWSGSSCEEALYGIKTRK